MSRKQEEVIYRGIPSMDPPNLCVETFGMDHLME
jgi:hypothetical protein